MRARVTPDEAYILMLSIAVLVCAVCVYFLVRAYYTKHKLKLAASTQVTFVWLTFFSSLCSAMGNVLALTLESEIVASEMLDDLRVVLDFWCNTYLMIFWLRVHFFVRYRSEKTLDWLWWIWASLNAAFIAFNVIVAVLMIERYLRTHNQEESANHYYPVTILVYVIAYMAVPVVVGLFGWQLYSLFRKWGQAFTPALSTTLRRIAIGTGVVCLCFVGRAFVIILVLSDTIKGDDVKAQFYIFYYIGLTALPQFIALYVMAVLVPKQETDGENHISDSKQTDEDGPRMVGNNRGGGIVVNDDYGAGESPMSQNFHGLEDDDGDDIPYSNPYDGEDWRPWNDSGDREEPPIIDSSALSAGGLERSTLHGGDTIGEG